MSNGSARRSVSTPPLWDTAQLAVGKMSSKQRVRRFPLLKVKVKQLKAKTPVKALDYFAFCIRKLLRLAKEKCGATRNEPKSWLETFQICHMHISRLISWHMALTPASALLLDPKATWVMSCDLGEISSSRNPFWQLNYSSQNTDFSLDSGRDFN